MKYLIVISVFTAIILNAPAFAQTDSVRIKTSALCEQCKEKIEKDLSFEKGIRSTNVDLASNEILVVYNAEKTSPEKIRIAVTKSGYRADSLAADEKAFRRLPECCRIPGKMEK